MSAPAPSAFEAEAVRRRLLTPVPPSNAATAPVATPEVTPGGGEDFEAQMIKAGVITPAWTKGVLPTVRAGVLGALDVPTFGLAGKAVAATGGPSIEEQKALAAAHPVARGVGGAVGLIGANLIPGAGEAADVGTAGEAAEAGAGAAEAGKAILQAKNLVPSNMVAALGEHLVPAAAEGAGAGARIAAGAGRWAVEGALFSAGQTAADIITNESIGDPDHAAEHILADGGMDALLTAGLGAAVGGAVSGAGVLADLVKPSILRAAKAAGATIREQQGQLAMDVLGVTKAGLSQLGNKSEEALDAVKQATGIAGDTWEEVVGNMAASPKAIYKNPATGAMERLIEPGDTAVQVAQRVAALRDEAGANMAALAGKMDAVRGPGINSGDLADTLDQHVERLKGDPSTLTTRGRLGAIADDLRENPRLLQPSEVWRMRVNNDGDINWKSIAGVDPGRAIYREVLDDAFNDYAENLQTMPKRDPLGRFSINDAAADPSLADMRTQWGDAKATYSLWATMGDIVDKGAAAAAWRTPTAADLASAAVRGGIRGAKTVGIMGAVAGHLGVGAAGGAALGVGAAVARALIGPRMASLTLEASRQLSETLGEAAPAIKGLVRDYVPDAVHSMWEAGERAAPEIAAAQRGPWALPANASADDVQELRDKLYAMQASGILLGELRHTAPALAAAIAGGSRRAAGGLLGRLPVPAAPGDPPTGKQVQAYNDYVTGMVAGPGPIMRAAAKGTATSHMVAGARAAYPTMAAKADALLADHLAKNPDLLDRRGVRAAAGLWFGAPDPRATATALAVQQARPSLPAAPAGPMGGPKGGRSRMLASGRVEKIAAPKESETATEGIDRRLGKED